MHVRALSDVNGCEEAATHTRLITTIDQRQHQYRLRMLQHPTYWSRYSTTNSHFRCQRPSCVEKHVASSAVDQACHSCGHTPTHVRIPYMYSPVQTRVHVIDGATAPHPTNKTSHLLGEMLRCLAHHRRSTRSLGSHLDIQMRATRVGICETHACVCVRLRASALGARPPQAPTAGAPGSSRRRRSCSPPRRPAPQLHGPQPWTPVRMNFTLGFNHWPRHGPRPGPQPRPRCCSTGTSGTTTAHTRSCASTQSSPLNAEMMLCALLNHPPRLIGPPCAPPPPPPPLLPPPPPRCV